MTPTPPDIEELLADGAEPPDSHLETLSSRLGSDAAAAGLLDVAHVIVPSPVGALLVAATDEGIVRIAFEVEGFDRVLDDLASRVGPRILAVDDDPTLLEAVAQLEGYFAATVTRFDLPLDLRLSRGFRRTVLDHLRDVPYGTTASYAELAAASGRPSAVRATASACASNPVPIVVPCHRVVRSDGSIGRYLGGAEAKAELLRMEAA